MVCERIREGSKRRWLAIFAATSLRPSKSRDATTTRCANGRCGRSRQKTSNQSRGAEKALTNPKITAPEAAAIITAFIGFFLV
jgi:hypothetical protein